jgi:adenylate cyclase
MKHWKNHLITLAIAAAFSLLYLAGALASLEDRLYDFFLRFRANRERLGNVVFLDIDDTAIFYNGVYPWPRSIPADGLLRLKEYGSYAAIFDIEYIEYGPKGVDDLYLNQGLGNDFSRSFSEINNNARDIFSALQAGRINRNDIEDIANSYLALVTGEQNILYEKARNIARDNDLYLAQAIGLFGRTWSTINLWQTPLEGEQAQRRPIAEERFSYPVNASAEARLGAGFVDILPALPVFSNAAKGAGFTNVEIDNDGIRRRVYLAQKIDNHWYLQLSFAPLIDWLGRPQIILEKNKLTIKNARFPGDKVKDIVIPLEQKGRMMLDWPKTDYNESFDHISFADFSLLDEIEAELEYYSRALFLTDLAFFGDFDPSLARVPILLGDLFEYYDAAYEAKNSAMENVSNDSFDAYLSCRIQIYSLLREIISLDIDKKVTELAYDLAEQYPEYAESIEDEADYISQLVNVIKLNNDRRYELSASNDKRLREKFVIIGRTDTGTTDIGANPFYGKYINVGTHGVVLDTILSESFITPLGIWWRIVFILVLIPLFFIVTSNLSPVLRASSGFIFTLLIFGAAVLLFRITGIYWGPLGAVIVMITALITREVISYSGSEKEKRFIRSAFSTYVSQDVVKEIISDPSRLQLGGTSRYMTAIFTDVKGFSTISEQLDPEALVKLLNKYLSAMSDVVLEEKGTIDKYEGDAIIAFFGAPIDLKDHAIRACVSAIRMRKIEKEMNKTIMENNLSPSPLLTRIGINTGHMVAGNMGTTNKMNYTIMGNAVNLAARLEGVNKQYGTWILASEDTIKETEGKLLTRKLDRVRVVGIKTPVRLHELIDIKESADEHSINLVNVFHEALNNFEKRNWDLAAEGFNEALLIKNSDEPSKMYAERCKNFIKKPPENSWDGVYNLTSK